MIMTILLGAALAICTVTDLRSRRIPNAVTMPLAVAGLAVNLFATCTSMVNGAVGLPSAVLGLLACFAVMLVIHLLADHGAGDVKLAAAIGACVGVEAGLVCIVNTYIVAGVVALAVSATRFLSRHMAPAGFSTSVPPSGEAPDLRAVGRGADPGIPLAPCFAASWAILQIAPATGGLSW